MSYEALGLRIGGFLIALWERLRQFKLIEKLSILLSGSILKDKLLALMDWRVGSGSIEALYRSIMRNSSRYFCMEV
jgi:hypothetical protein